MGYGMYGIGFSISLTYAFEFFLLTFFLSRDKEIKEAWFSPTKESLSDMKGFFKIGLPSAIMLCVEFLSFEAIILFSGYISIESLGASALAINCGGLMFVTCIGFMVAGTALVGRSIGKGDLEGAKRYQYLIQSLSVWNALITWAIVYFLRY
jgi:MATE family multidrug resistance protein